MLGLAGLTLGERFVFMDPSREACARHVGDLFVGSYDDVAALAELSRRSDVVTYEFENIPVECARFLADRVPVHPPARALEISQDRFFEKSFFAQQGVPTAEFASVESKEEMERAIATIGLPAVVKTRRFGYDGKGQAVLRTDDDVKRAWIALGAAKLIVEKLVPFEREASIIAVRGKSGETRFYPLIENVHHAGILRASFPGSSRLAAHLQAEAEAHATKVLDALSYVGVLTIEFFVHDGHLVANEMAPRVHNSGHFSIEGAETSQFENHVRAILGLPLGPTSLLGEVAMLNAIGKLPPRAEALALPGVHFHSYGKDSAPGRKVGHVTLRAKTREELGRLFAQCRQWLDADGALANVTP
jgi:5-(carboxyamino)imidazole ribonucleotide synthase